MVRLATIIGSLIIICTADAMASNVTDKLNGNTLGAAATHISTLENSLIYATKPSITSGTEDSSVNKNVICAEIGEAVGLAFAARDSIAFYTSSEIIDTKVISESANRLIDTVADIRNDFCVGLKQQSVQQVMNRISGARLQAETLRQNINKRVEP